MLRAGREQLTFEAAIAQEPERLRGQAERILADEGYDSVNHQCYSYLARGVYVDQLRTWLSYFPREQMLILKSEDLYAHPSLAIKQVLAFLDLPEWEPSEYKTYHAQPYAKMEAATRALLVDYFAPFNQQLYALLGRDFGWDV